MSFIGFLACPDILVFWSVHWIVMSVIVWLFLKTEEMFIVGLDEIYYIYKIVTLSRLIDYLLMSIVSNDMNKTVVYGLS